MVVALNALPVQELRTADGHVYAVVLSPEEFARMQAEAQVLREQVATLQRQKNHYVAEVERLLRTTIPIPHTEAEVRAAVPNSDELHRLISDLGGR